MKHLGLLILLTGCVVSASAQVTYERLLNTDQEPGNWLTYSGNYDSHRFSRLEQISRDNVGELELKWVYQMPTLVKVETTPWCWMG